MSPPNWGCDPAVLVVHAMDTHPAIGLGQVVVSDVGLQLAIDARIRLKGHVLNDVDLVDKFF